MRILADAPAEGLSLDEIQAETEARGFRLYLRDINKLICDLGGKVGQEKVKVKDGRYTVKVTKFFLKLTRS